MTLTEQEVAQPLRQTHRIFAVLVTHDGARWLPQTVRALHASTRQPDSLIVVDTHSGDNSTELVAPLQPLLLRADRDEGFGDAVALAVEQLPSPLEGVVDWIWILHDDFAPQEDCLERLIAAVDDSPSVAIAGPKLRGWHDSAHLLEIGISIAANGSRWTGLERRERDQGQHDGNAEVLSVSTAGMLVRRDVWTELEGLDPNISLFRDDVDFGWRANVAGYRVLCVTDAIGRHAEAAATERREIDVQGALRRPHLLDRRHGAYVLLANCSTTRVPVVFLRLVLSSLLRSIGYLFAKLPGYAVDEVAGLLLFVSRPDLLRQARSARKARRLLPASSVRPLLAPFGSQVRTATEALRGLILRGWDAMATPSTSYTLVNEGEDDFDVIEEPLLRRILLRPGVALFTALSLVALMAGRNRWGSISGGALLPAPSGARDLFTTYFEPWHHVSLGSNLPTPFWSLILALLSAITLGNISTLISLLFMICVPASAMLMYAVLRSRVTQHWYAAVGALIYALSPPVLTSVTSGRLAGVVLSLIMPIGIKLAMTNTWTWRRIWGAALLLGIVVGFSPILFVLALLAGLLRCLRRPGEWREWTALLVAAFLMNAPWSLSALTHPTRWLGEAGLGLSGGRPATLLTFNPGGMGSPPLWLSSSLILAALLLMVLSHRRHRTMAMIVLGIVTCAQFAAAATFRIHDSGDPIRVYTGSILIVAIALIVVASAEASEEIKSELSTSPFGVRHLTVGVLLVTSLLSALGSTAWFVATDSPVKAHRGEILPAFVAELSKSEEGKRTLVLDTSTPRVHFGVLRGRELNLVDADVAIEDPRDFTDAVSTLVAGADDQTIDKLNRFNIGFILMSRPIDQELARTLDSVGGLARLSVTDGRILWKVGGSHGLVRLVDREKVVTTLVREGDDLHFNVPGPGVIQLSERASSGWKAIGSGVLLTPVSASDGMQAFAIGEAGRVVISYDSPAHRVGLAVALVTLLSLLLLIAPSGRRLSEQSDEELT